MTDLPRGCGRWWWHVAVVTNGYRDDGTFLSPVNWSLIVAFNGLSFPLAVVNSRLERLDKSRNSLPGRGLKRQSSILSWQTVCPEEAGRPFAMLDLREICTGDDIVFAEAPSW